MKYFVILSLILYCSILTNAQNCKYDRNGLKDIPTYNQVVSYVGVNVRSIQGKVVDWKGAIIAKSIVSLHRKTQNGLNFIGFLVVGKDGRFCFKNMPNGKYVIKAGLEGFNRTEIEFNLNSKNQKAKNKFDITLELGT